MTIEQMDIQIEMMHNISYVIILVIMLILIGTMIYIKLSDRGMIEDDLTGHETNTNALDGLKSHSQPLQADHIRRTKLTNLNTRQ